MKDTGSAQQACPDVSVVVVTYNGREHIEGCLRSLLAHSPFPATEILVVDNASSDDSAELSEQVAAAAPGIRVVRSDRNLGYAGGVNLALAHARGGYIAVLNQDMAVEPGWLAPPLALLEEDASVGAVSPMLVLYSDDQRINSLGQNVHVTGLGFNRWLGRPRRDAGHQPLRVAGLHGGAFVIRRSILDELGGWDSSGFLYHEDVELSWLLHLLGYAIYCTPSAAVRHKYHLEMYPEKLFLLERNRWTMLLCNLQPVTWLALAPLLLFTEALMWGYCLLRGGGFIRAKWRSYRRTPPQRRAIRERRGWIRTRRRRSDGQVLRRLKWQYAWDQFFTLGRGRQAAARRGNIPPDAQ